MLRKGPSSIGAVAEESHLFSEPSDPYVDSAQLKKDHLREAIISTISLETVPLPLPEGVLPPPCECVAPCQLRQCKPAESAGTGSTEPQQILWVCASAMCGCWSAYDPYAFVDEGLYHEPLTQEIDKHVAVIKEQPLTMKEFWDQVRDNVIMPENNF